jgi:hypothetical protein
MSANKQQATASKAARAASSQTSQHQGDVASPSGISSGLPHNLPPDKPVHAGPSDLSQHRPKLFPSSLFYGPSYSASFEANPPAPAPQPAFEPEHLVCCLSFTSSSSICCLLSFILLPPMLTYAGFFRASRSDYLPPSISSNSNFLCHGSSFFNYPTRLTPPRRDPFIHLPSLSRPQ